MREIDARGLNCPQPVILAKNAMKEISEGTIKVLVDNDTAKENLRKFAGNNGFGIEIEGKGQDFFVFLTKGVGEANIPNLLEDEESLNCEPRKKGTVVVLKSDRFGAGAEDLGTLLMKSYTFALSESVELPAAMLLLNGGVKLACEGSAVVENLKKIMESGTEIFCCGTCLDFFNLKEKQLVGEVGNMYMFIEKMNSAAKVITIG